MAINKKLIHFNSKTNFENEVANDNILDTSIVFIKDTKEIGTHGQFYGSNTSEANVQAVDIGESVEDVVIPNTSVDLSNYYTKSEIDDTIENITSQITTDTSMSDSSTNPVQNKIIKSYIDGNCNIPVETTTEITKTLTANKYYRWTNTPTSITITLAASTNSNILNNYMFEFTTSSSGCTLSVPSSIKWLNDTAPIIEANKTYQISIINDLATVAKFG